MMKVPNHMGTKFHLRDSGPGKPLYTSSDDVKHDLQHEALSLPARLPQIWVKVQTGKTLRFILLKLEPHANLQASAAVF